MEEKAMEDKLSASCGEQSWSSTCGFGRSSGGENGVEGRKNSLHHGASVVLTRFCSTPPPLATRTCFSLGTTTPHCKCFACLDKYVSSFFVKEDANKGEVFEDMVKLEEKMFALENLVAGRSAANRESVISKSWGSVFFLLGIVFTIGFLALIRV
ncbi:hypothetical protein PIB30_073378 [Stylosanthes scabra]|uniref:Uncharacterized protein n=1 Tax=Stylosanthes scabra TaxID=79078 RepID=A0ABU6TP40_9FABA|nr:hypothetical protein [Stylosanthes scabra]